MMKILPLLLVLVLFLACSDDDAAGAGYQPVTNFTPLAASNFSTYPVTLPPGGFFVLYTSNHQAPLANTAGEWWHDAVIYQVFTAKFNSGALPTSRLDYLTNIGFAAVWTTPIFSSPSEHGYDITDYYTVKPGYGGNSGLDTYVAAAHQRGVRVVLDMVLNHTGSGNQWFVDSVNNINDKRDWYVWTNTLPAGWQCPWGGGEPGNVWHSNNTAGMYYYAAFSGVMPDLNLANTAVRDEIKAIGDYWIGKGVDGFRLDAARYAIETGPWPDQADTAETKAWWVDYQTHLAGTKADFYTVGEFWTDSFDQLDGYYSSGTGLSQGFSFQFYQALRGSLYYGHSSYLLAYLSAVAGATAPPSFFAPFIDNHDEPDGNLRFMDRLAGEGNKNWELAKAGAAILLTIPGTPYVYYGTEIGMNKGPESGDAAKRTAMDWTAVNTQLADQNSLLHTWKRLLALRRQEAALRRGALTPLAVADSGVVAWLRPGPERSVIVIVNLSGVTKKTFINFNDSGLSSGTVHHLYPFPVGTARGMQQDPTSGYAANCSSMYLRGSFNGWDGSNPMQLVANYTWRTTVSGLSGGETFKFEATGESTWGDNWGDNNGDGTAWLNENNIINTRSGTVTFTFNDSTLRYTVSN